MWYVYILSLANGQYYVWSTNDLERRIQQHYAGKVIATKGKLPLEVMYVKQYTSLIEARKMEYCIKRMKSRKFIETFMNS
jgi:predicted GIY-YIG superfamily endonuclease